MKRFIKISVTTGLLLTMLSTTVFASTTTTRFDFINKVVDSLMLKDDGQVVAQFNDLNESEKETVQIALTNGIVNGYDNGNFGADDVITFEQAITIYVNSKGLKEISDLTNSEITNLLADKEAMVSDWAKEYIALAVKNNIITVNEIPADNALSEYVYSKLMDNLSFNGTDILSSHNWQGSKVYDENGNDLTEENNGFISYAKFDNMENRYEFFDKSTGETKGDEGYYFVSGDGAKRVTASTSKNYSAALDLVLISENKFTYSRMGKDKQGNEVKIFVEHVPYNGNLEFTNDLSELSKTTGMIETETSGNEILGNNLWQGSKVFDEEGNNITEFNMNFISIAKFDDTNNKYEFFDTATGETKGDFGYYDVIRNNKMRFTVSVGKGYFAPLELTELNKDKFTYTRMGKDEKGNEIKVTVEHVPYNGELNVEFTN